MTSLSELKIGTYNILNPFHAVKWDTAEGLNDDGGDNWDEWRRDQIIQNIVESDLDVCALQEVSHRTYPELRERLNHAGYEMTSLYTHFTHEDEGAHGVTVLFKRDRLECLRDVKLSTLEDDFRCATSCDFFDHSSRQIFRIVSVHLKGYDPYQTDIPLKRESQIRGDNELRVYLSQLAKEANSELNIFILGDFNEDALEMEARGSTSRQGILLSLGYTWCGHLAPTEIASGRQIDWIFFKPSADFENCLSYQDQPQVLSASDHALTVNVLSDPLGELLHPLT